jgi:glycosyltransferase involved in cell wall biosynthesis
VESGKTCDLLHGRETTVSKKILLVIIQDRISVLLKKGEYAPRYYNPGDLFDEVHIFQTNDDQPDLIQLQPTVGRAKLEVHNIPRPTFFTSLGYHSIQMRKWAKKAIELAQKICPDVIRVHGIDLQLYLAGEIKRALQTPIIVSLHGNPDVDYMRLIHNPLARLVYWRRQQVSQSYLHNVDHFVAVYSPILSFFHKHHLSNYSIIYNVVGIDAVIKMDYTIQEGIARCICVGRQDRDQKDVRAIIHAVSEIPNVELYLYGNGNLHETLVKLTHELNILERVFFKTSIPNSQLMQELSQYDIYVYNSINYEISKTVIEAALVGLPIIHNLRDGGLSQELSGDYIYKVQNSTDGYIQGIQTLITDTTLRKKLGEAARHHASQNWSPEVSELRYTELYRSIMPEF